MSQQANDSVSERRLRPIYDWLDLGNNKKAVQEADRVLKKQPDFQCCRVLKALALVRLGRFDEAIEILDKVLDESPVEDSVLQAMTIGFKETHQLPKICVMYEKAVKKEPTNEEFLSHLFMSYVRMDDLKKQQATAMNLYKVQQKKPYYFWSVMSLVLQSTGAVDEMKKSVILPLACKMMEKLEKENKFDQDQEKMLYLLILELRQDWEGCLRILNGPLGKELEESSIYELPCRKLILEANEKLANWEQVVRLSRNYLLNQPDQWNCYLSYITAILHLIKDSGGNADSSNSSSCGVYDLNPERVDRSVAEAEQLFDRLAQHNTNIRGPKLARLELYSRLKDIDDKLFEDLPNQITNYVAEFGTKNVCFSDVKKYLQFIPESQRDDFISSLESKFAKEEFQSVKDICQDICVIGIARYLGKHLAMSSEQQFNVVHILVKKYEKCQPLVCHMEGTELRQSDNYLLLASHILWDLALAAEQNQKDGSSYLRRGITLLMYGLTTSSSNWQLKLLLIKFGSELGAYNMIAGSYQSLDVKQLMYDTLGWFMFRLNYSFAQHKEAGVLHREMKRFYTYYEKEITENIIQAFKMGNFSQLLDMYRLKGRIGMSHNFYLIEIESNFEELTTSTLSHIKEIRNMKDPNFSPFESETVKWGELRDNRDMTVMLTWDPPARSVNQQMIQNSFQDEKDYCEMRLLLLQSVCCAIHTVEDTGSDNNSQSANHHDNNLKDGKKTDDSKMSNGSSLERDLLANYTKQLELLYNILASKQDTTPNIYPPQAPYRCRLPCYLSSQQVPTILLVLRTVATFHDMSLHQEKFDETSALSSLENISKQLTILKEKLSSNPDFTCHSNSVFLSRRIFSCWELYNHILQTINLVVLLVGLISSILKSAKAASKKLKGVYKFGPVAPAFTKLVEDIQSFVQFIVNSLESFKVEASMDAMAEELSELSLGESGIVFSHLKEGAKLVHADIETSYKQQTERVRLLWEKLTVLKDLKC